MQPSSRLFRTDLQRLTELRLGRLRLPRLSLSAVPILVPPCVSIIPPTSFPMCRVQTLESGNRLRTPFRSILLLPPTIYPRSCLDGAMSFPSSSLEVRCLDPPARRACPDGPMRVTTTRLRKLVPSTA